MEYQEKKSTGKTVTIVILIIIVLGLAGYIAYFDYYVPNYENKSKVEEVDDGEEDDSREMYVDEYVKMQDKLDSYLYFAEEFSKGDVKNFDNQTLLMFAINNIEGVKDSYGKDEVTQLLENYFSTNVTVNHEDIICLEDNQVLYKFEDNAYKVNKQHPPHDGTGFYSGEVHVIGGTVEKDKYILKTRILYQHGNSGFVDSSYYKNVEDAKANKNSLNTNSGSTEYHDIESFIPITTFTFNKKGNDYFLENVKIDS